MKKIYGLLTVLLISGCAAEKVQTDLPVENLYNNAFDDLQKTKYKKAAEEFDSSEDKEEIEVKPIRKGEKIGRNDPCPCGSGKKYKNCCMNKVDA